MADVVLRDKAGTRYSYDRLVTEGWLDGQPVGADAVIAFLRREATKLFEAGKDNEAIAMRRLADRARDEVRPELVKASTENKRKYPAQLTDDEDDD